MGEFVADIIVIPVKTGIQENQVLMDALFRGSDGPGAFYETIKVGVKRKTKDLNNRSTR